MRGGDADGIVKPTGDLDKGKRFRTGNFASGVGHLGSLGGNCLRLRRGGDRA